MSSVAASRIQKKKTSASGVPSLAGMMSAAVAAHEKGDLAKAEQAYRAVLAVSPEFPDALQLLGVARHQQGFNDEALEMLGRAKALAPRNADIRGNLGSVLNAL